MGRFTHSYRTATICEEIAKRLFLKQEYIDVAWLLGLLHDIARFEQAKRFNSFLDTPEFDHGDYGVKILFEDALIREFSVKEEYYSLLENPIRYHNKMSVGQCSSLLEKLFCNMIRDADKIDIFYQVNQYAELYKTFDDISDDAIRYIAERQLVPYSVVQTKGDKYALLSALIFDFNIPCSLDIVKEKGDFYHFLHNCFSDTDKEKIKKVQGYILAYLEETEQAK